MLFESLPSVSLLRRWYLLLAIGVLFVGGRSASAQTVDLSGRVYMDYYYRFSNPDASVEDLHGFTFRRLYLTADYRLSEAFSGRARLEADDGSLTGAGSYPVVKDLYLTWESGSGHAITTGITPTPVFRISEDVWGYRSLDKTLLDLNDIAGSRDFGIRATGPITGSGSLRYAVMYANNSGKVPEFNKSKRVYAQLQVFPSNRLSFTLGGDYAGYGDRSVAGLELSSKGLTLNAFGGYVSPRFRAGLEGYWSRISYENELAELPFREDASLDRYGASLFAALQLAERWEGVARVDRGRHEVASGTWRRTYAIVGLQYQPQEQVHLIPNLRLLNQDGEEADLRARLTLHVDF